MQKVTTTSDILSPFGPRVGVTRGDIRRKGGRRRQCDGLRTLSYVSLNTSTSKPALCGLSDAQGGGALVSEDRQRPKCLAMSSATEIETRAPDPDALGTAPSPMSLSRASDSIAPASRCNSLE